MKKVPLSDNSGRWFDKDKTKVFEAAYFYHPNGNPDRPICLATDSEHNRETLYYLTEQATFILHCADDSGISAYADIDLKAATQWLIANGHQHKLAQLELLSEEADLEC